MVLILKPKKRCTLTSATAAMQINEPEVPPAT